MANITKQVVVASMTLSKLRAVQCAFDRVYPGENIQYIGISVDSGISDQPMSDSETLLGALNRVAQAKRLKHDADFYVGIEGGVYGLQDELYLCGWVVVRDKHDRIAKAAAARVILPNKIQTLIRDGVELCDAVSSIYDAPGVLTDRDTVSPITNNLISRADYYEHALIFAVTALLADEANSDPLSLNA